MQWGCNYVNHTSVWNVWVYKYVSMWRQLSNIKLECSLYHHYLAVSFVVLHIPIMDVPGQKLYECLLIIYHYVWVFANFTNIIHHELNSTIHPTKPSVTTVINTESSVIRKYSENVLCAYEWENTINFERILTVITLVSDKLYPHVNFIFVRSMCHSVDKYFWLSFYDMMLFYPVVMYMCEA